MEHYFALHVPAMMQGRVLIVDDDDDVREAVEAALQGLGHEIRACRTGEEALRALAVEEFDLVLTDVRMPSLDGIQLCQRIAENHADLPVVVMTAYGDVPTVAGAMRAAAIDFLEKPFTTEELGSAVQRGLSRPGARRPGRRTGAPSAPADVPELVGSSPAMAELRELVVRYGSSDSTVVVSGERGTPKGLVARALHRRSRRSDGPFVALDCATITPSALADELLGRPAGAAGTPAWRGPFLEADGGTLLIDEIGAMPLELQPALLRVLEERTVRRVGEPGEQAFDARIVVATTRPLSEAARDGALREDLLLRLSVLRVHVPALRERTSDVLELSERFLRAVAEGGAGELSLADDAVEALVAYDWPGNDRELEEVLRSAAGSTRDRVIRRSDLPLRVLERASQPAVAGADAVGHSLEEVERRHIEMALRATSNNKAEAARRLGIDRTTLYRKLRRFGIE